MLKVEKPRPIVFSHSWKNLELYSPDLRGGTREERDGPCAEGEYLPMYVPKVHSKPEVAVLQNI